MPQPERAQASTATEPCEIDIKMQTIDYKNYLLRCINKHRTVEAPQGRHFLGAICIWSNWLMARQFGVI